MCRQKYTQDATTIHFLHHTLIMLNAKVRSDITKCIAFEIAINTTHKSL